MNKTFTFFLLLLSISIYSQDDFDYRVITYSQIGYDIELPKVAMIQHKDSTFLSAKASFFLKQNSTDKKVYSGAITPQGKKWDKFWWKIDFTDCNDIGEYYLTIEDGKHVQYNSKKELPIKIDKDLLWDETWYKTALAHLKIRDSLSYQPEGGWKDCGSPLQEVSSHIIMLNALCDVIELTSNELSNLELEEAHQQIIIGANYQ